jgi:hypothetical protein
MKSLGNEKSWEREFLGMRSLGVPAGGMMAACAQLKEEFGTSSGAVEIRVCCLHLVSNELGMQQIWAQQIRRRPCEQGGNRSEDDADKAGYGQNEDRCDGEQPEHPGLAFSPIGGLVVAKRRGHRDLL